MAGLNDMIIAKSEQTFVKRGYQMLHYEKTAFYVYPKLKAMIKGIDETFIRKIYDSKSDTSPALYQCETLLKITDIKQNLLFLKAADEKVYNELSDEKKELLSYKYFRLGKGGALPLHGKSVRSYYRRQIRLAKEIKELLSGFGVTEDWFEKNLLTVPFIKEEQKKVELRERLMGIEEEKENLAAKNGESDYYNLDNVYAGDDGVPFFTGFSSEDEKSFGTDSDPERLEKRNLFAAAEMLKIEEEKEKAKKSGENTAAFTESNAGFAKTATAVPEA